MSELIFVYLDHAYTSELALAKHEGVASDEASLFDYEGEAPEVLWRVQGGPEVDLITDSLVDALAEQIAGDADLLHSIDVVGSDNALRDLHPMVMARGPEFVPDYLRS